MKSVVCHIVIALSFVILISTPVNSQSNYTLLLENYYTKADFSSYFYLLDSITKLAAEDRDLGKLTTLCTYVKRDFKEISKNDRKYLRKSATYLANDISKLTSDRKIPLELYLISHENVSNKNTLDSISWFIENKICIIYIEKGNYEKADYFGSLLERSLRHYNQLEYLSRYYTNKGRSLASQLHLSEAQKLYVKGYLLADSIGYLNGVFSNAINLAELYNTYPEMGEPEEYLKRANSILHLISQDKEYKWRQGSYIIETARDTLRKGFNEIGFHLFNSGINLLDEYYVAYQKRQIAKQYAIVGLAYLKADSTLQALQSFYKGLAYLIPESKNKTGLPSNQELYDENSFLDLLELWQSICEKNYAETHDIQFVSSALAANELALNCNDLLRERLIANGSKLLSVRDNKELIHRGVAYLHTLYLHDSIRTPFGKIRSYFSRSKSLIYSENRERNQVAFSMNEANRKQWISLLDTIQFLREEKYEVGADILYINGEILRCKERIEQIFRAYKDLSKKIHSPDNYLEYLVTDQDVYMIAEIYGNKYFGKIGSVQDLEKLLKRLNHFIELKGYSLDTDILSDIYQFLIQPLNMNLPAKFEIIPDGEIGYIPFEILQDLSGQYLIRSSSIAYQLEFENEILEPVGKGKQWDIVLLAPQYPKKDAPVEYTRGSFFHLPYAEAEIDTIAKLFGGRAVKTKSSNREEWLPKLTDTNIFHYAGHAVVDGNQAYLALISNDTVRSKLTVEDIRLMHFPLDLVVLSACETGLGQLQIGEGIESLGRSFMEAGARSTLISLWNVNDKSTAIIMAGFYKYLKEGKTKDESIRQAKLDFLDSVSSKLRHPFFWGAFIPAGNMDSL